MTASIVGTPISTVGTASLSLDLGSITGEAANDHALIVGWVRNSAQTVNTPTGFTSIYAPYTHFRAYLKKLDGSETTTSVTFASDDYNAALLCVIRGLDQDATLTNIVIDADTTVGTADDQSFNGLNIPDNDSIILLISQRNDDCTFSTVSGFTQQITQNMSSIGGFGTLHLQTKIQTSAADLSAGTLADSVVSGTWRTMTIALRGGAAVITGVSSVTAESSFTITGTGFNASSNVVTLKKASQGINYSCTVTSHSTTSLTVTCPGVPNIGTIGSGYTVTVTPSGGDESDESSSFSIAAPVSAKATTLVSLADASVRMTATADAVIGDQFYVFNPVGVADASNVTLRDDGSIKVPEALTSISAKLYSSYGWGPTGTQTFQSQGPTFIGPLLNDLELTFQQNVPITPIDFSTRFTTQASSVADPSFVGVGAVATGGFPLSIAAPTRAAGDVLVLHVVCAVAQDTQSTPSGWTLPTISWPNTGHRVYLRAATNTSADDAVASWSSAEHAIGFIEAYRGLDTDLASVIVSSSSQSNAAASDVAYPVLSVPTARSVVLVSARKKTTWTSVAPISNFTETVGYSYDAASVDVSATSQRWIQTTATDVASGNISVTGGTANYSSVIMLSLKPATVAVPATYSTLDPSLPTGLALSSAGVLSGIPTAVGVIGAFKVTATAGGQSADSNAATITVQATAPQITVPSVVGLDIGAALTALSNAGEIDGEDALTATPITYAYSSSVIGTILSQSPPAGTIVSVLTDVALSVSQGGGIIGTDEDLQNLLDPGEDLKGILIVQRLDTGPTSSYYVQPIGIYRGRARWVDVLTAWDNEAKAAAIREALTIPTQPDSSLIR